MLSRKVRQLKDFENYAVTSDKKIYSYNSKQFVKVVSGVATLWRDEKPHKVNVKELAEKYFPYKNRMKKTYRSVLSEEQVKEMRKVKETTFKTYAEIAEMFKVNKSTAFKVCQRIYWKDIK